MLAVSTSNLTFGVILLRCFLRWSFATAALLLFTAAATPSLEVACAAPPATSPSRAWTPYRTAKARVVYVSDGDTITVRLQDDPDQEKERVRLIGIDVPETNDTRPEYKELALDARAFATQNLKGRIVTLERDATTDNRDGFGRMLRYVVTSDGTNFNELMIRRGYGRVYRRFKFSLKERFIAAEKHAQAAGSGYWKLPSGPSRVVPAPTGKE